MADAVANEVAEHSDFISEAAGQTAVNESTLPADPKPEGPVVDPAILSTKKSTLTTAAARRLAAGTKPLTPSSVLNKPPTRPTKPPGSSASATAPSVANVRRSIPGHSSGPLSTSAHKTRPSVSEDEKKFRRTTLSSQNSGLSSPSKPTERNTLTVASSRKPAGGSGITPSPRMTPSLSTNGQTLGTTTKPTTSSKPLVASRQSAATTGVIAEAKRRLSYSVTSPTLAQAAKPSSRLRPSTFNLSTPTTDLVQEFEELKAKNDNQQREIEPLAAPLEAINEYIPDLGTLASKDITDPHAPVLEISHHAAGGSSQTTLAELNEKLNHSEALLEKQRADYERVCASRDVATSELAVMSTSLETMQTEHEEALKSLDVLLQSAAEARTSALEALETSLSGIHSSALDALQAKHTEELSKAFEVSSGHETALEELKSCHQAALVSLNDRIAALVASESSLQSAHEQSLQAQRLSAAAQRSSIEAELGKVNILLQDTQSAAAVAQYSNDELARDLSSLRADLLNLQNEYDPVKESLSTREAELDAIKAKLQEAQDDSAKKEQQLGQLKSKHDEELKQISHDYEEEIESLRGDAYFKRRYEELTKTHDTVQEELVKVTAKLKDTEVDYHQALESLNASHIAALEASRAEDAKWHQAELDALKLSHSAHIEDLQGDSEASTKRAEALEASHNAALETLRRESEESSRNILSSHQDELAALMAQMTSDHEAALVASKQAWIADSQAESAALTEKLQSSHESALIAAKENMIIANQHELRLTRENLVSSHEDELATLKGKMREDHTVELQRLEARIQLETSNVTGANEAHAAAIEALENRLSDEHAVQIESLITTHAESLDRVRQDGISTAQNSLKALEQKHTEAIDYLKNQHAEAESAWKEALAQQQASVTELNASLEHDRIVVTKLEVELAELSQQLALEKMERAVAQAALEEARMKKTDTTELDNLRAELLSLKTDHQVSLGALQAELKVAKETVEDLQQDLDISQKDLESHTLQADAHSKTAVADYQDMHDTLSQLLEERVADVKTLRDRVTELEQVLTDSSATKATMESVVEELAAQVKAKDAEIISLQGVTKASQIGLSEQIPAETNEHPAAESGRDFSSAAAASLAKIAQNLEQMDAIDREMRESNIQMMEDLNGPSSVPAFSDPPSTRDGQL